MRHLEVMVVTEQTTAQNILNWKVTTVTNVETAIERLQQRPYKVVAISDTIPKTEKSKLHQITAVLYDDTIIVEFGNDTPLAETVKKAYWSKNKPGSQRHYLDNSFEIQLANSINVS
ncbi:hypothetical protein [Snuella sedimenti]|uniref:Uncharacterized protein n=1 Tax=Snuella sedimenti TaxID=2798802 RepID=A0A8J7J0G0_9FLAO|nr:hypothetical protein [Snuella sedimenti]MBJ6366734.1 hypothetical protein [Snuella sedimenti]